jgi:hypothetical protein
VIWTLQGIADAVGVADRRTVLALAMRARDPLRVRLLIDKYWIRESVVEAWKLRQIDGCDLPRVVGLQTIATEVHRSINGTKALARRAQDPLPIFGLGERAPWIYESALQDWIDAQDRPFQPRPECTQLTDDSELAA